MLLKGKRLVISGIRDRSSLAFAVARRAQQEGAELFLTVHGRAAEMARDAIGDLAEEAQVREVDFTDPDDVAALRQAVGERWDRVDGALHAIAFAPRSCLGGDMFRAPWSDVAVTINTSAFTLRTLAEAVVPAMSQGGSIVSLSVDTRFAAPGYDWMGVAKSALESTARYLARDLGPKRIRVNLVNAGPQATISAGAIPGSEDFGTAMRRAPLGWDMSDTSPTAMACVALFSDLFPATTGDIINVDGGAHFIIDPPPDAAKVI